VCLVLGFIANCHAGGKLGGHDYRGSPVVLHCRVVAVVAPALGEAVEERLAPAILGSAHVVCVRVQPQKAYLTIQLAYTVLEGSACETPLQVGGWVWMRGRRRCGWNVRHTWAGVREGGVEDEEEGRE